MEELREILFQFTVIVILLAINGFYVAAEFALHPLFAALAAAAFAAVGVAVPSSGAA